MPKPEGLQERQTKPADSLGDVAKRVAAGIAVIRGIRQFTSANAIENNQKHSIHG
jgi:hypothetical protein